ncbi:uncharacterized protein [Oscarella lobularis]|uniref:uncharacterized protein isoform X1 n=1 Tax=Oscarella lobularis TaxID=121494 RepID=UPI0033144BE1
MLARNDVDYPCERRRTCRIPLGISVIVSGVLGISFLLFGLIFNDSRSGTYFLIVASILLGLAFGSGVGTWLLPSFYQLWAEPATRQSVVSRFYPLNLVALSLSVLGCGVSLTLFSMAEEPEYSGNERMLLNGFISGLSLFCFGLILLVLGLCMQQRWSFRHHSRIEENNNKSLSSLASPADKIEQHVDLPSYNNQLLSDNVLKRRSISMPELPGSFEEHDRPTVSLLKRSHSIHDNPPPFRSEEPPPLRRAVPTRKPISRTQSVQSAEFREALRAASMRLFQAENDVVDDSSLLKLAGEEFIHTWSETGVEFMKPLRRPPEVVGAGKAQSLLSVQPPPKPARQRYYRKPNSSLRLATVATSQSAV